jgi:hypothetical protein
MPSQDVARDTQSPQPESGLGNSIELSNLPRYLPPTSSSRSIIKYPGAEPREFDDLDQRASKPAGWIVRLHSLRDSHPRIRQCYTWLQGPIPPVSLQPTPLLDSTNLRWRNRAVRINLGLESWWLKHANLFRRKWLLVLLGAGYVIGLAFISRANSFLTPAESFVDCTSTYWLKDDGCGLNGQLCSPFTGPDFEFRCPGNCLSVTLANPRTVGAQEVVYRSLVVGGGDSNKTYRGDSWICPAAIQA